MPLSLSPDQRKALVRGYLESTWNAPFDEKEASSPTMTYAEDGQRQRPSCSEIVVPPATIAIGMQCLDVSLVRKKMRTTFPDLHFTITDMVVEGEKVVVRWLMQGTDLGGYDDYPPTGRAMSLTGLTLLHMDGQKIIEEWIEADVVGMLRQLGFVSVPQPLKITMRRPGPSRSSRL